MNAFPGLTWELSERSNTVDLIVMTITIDKANKIETTIFEKKMNLHLYIPPHSAHLPGLLPGIVYSTLFRIFTLCLSKDGCRILGLTPFNSLLQYVNRLVWEICSVN